jgi:hypothetical protein
MIKNAALNFQNFCQEMLGDAFKRRGLGPLEISVRLLSGTPAAQTTSPALAHGGGGGEATAFTEGPPVRVSIEESDVPDEGRNPYIALGWYSLTEDLPHKRSGARPLGGPANGSAAPAPGGDSARKVVVCLGGGPTCNFEFERACIENIHSLWYCLYLPPRLPAPEGRADEDQSCPIASQASACEPAAEGSRPLQSSVNVAHAHEAIKSIPPEEWRFGGCVYNTKVVEDIANRP